MYRYEQVTQKERWVWMDSGTQCIRVDDIKRFEIKPKLDGTDVTYALYAVLSYDKTVPQNIGFAFCGSFRTWPEAHKYVKEVVMG